MYVIVLCQRGYLIEVANVLTNSALASNDDFEFVSAYWAWPKYRAEQMWGQKGKLVVKSELNVLICGSTDDARTGLCNWYWIIRVNTLK